MSGSSEKGSQGKKQGEERRGEPVNNHYLIHFQKNQFLYQNVYVKMCSVGFPGLT